VSANAFSVTVGPPEAERTRNGSSGTPRRQVKATTRGEDVMVWRQCSAELPRATCAVRGSTTTGNCLSVGAPSTPSTPGGKAAAGRTKASKPSRRKPGHGGWNELNTTDWEAAFLLYSRLFGWEKSTPMDMGPMGVYQLFSAGGAEAIGAMFNSPETPRPHWLFYFNVENIDAAQGRLAAAGGSILMGPHPVPGDLWMIQARDPQGAPFAIVGPRVA
jgi:predicted enzyme related to lactoylglutathione lyase